MLRLKAEVGRAKSFKLRLLVSDRQPWNLLCGDGEENVRRYGDMASSAPITQWELSIGCVSGQCGYMHAMWANDSKISDN